MTTDWREQPKALLCMLSERTSARGGKYFLGWLGNSRLVLFPTEDTDEYGNPQWRAYVQESPPRQQKNDATKNNRRQENSTAENSRAAENNIRPDAGTRKRARKAAPNPGRPFHDDEIPF